MRIVSLLPSATEILFALGLDEEVVGVTQECDVPAAARSKPKVTRSVLADQDLTSSEIDVRVVELRESGGGVYELDVDLLAELQPDLIFTQSLCDVCAVPHGIVRESIPKLPTRPHVYSLDPSSVGDVLSNVKTVGDATRRQVAARVLVDGLRKRIDAVTLASAQASSTPRVFCLEWLDPPWTAGHWVPEMVGMAGGFEIFGGAGQPSRRTGWDEVARLEPEVIVVMPCGFDLPRTLAELARSPLPSDVLSLPAGSSRRVFAVDGSAHFNRPGPRLVDGLEVLASLFHPELFGSPPADRARRIDSPPA